MSLLAMRSWIWLLVFACMMISIRGESDLNGNGEYIDGESQFYDGKRVIPLVKLQKYLYNVQPNVMSHPEVVTLTSKDVDTSDNNYYKYNFDLNSKSKIEKVEERLVKFNRHLEARLTNTRDKIEDGYQSDQPIVAKPLANKPKDQPYVFRMREGSALAKKNDWLDLSKFEPPSAPNREVPDKRSTPVTWTCHFAPGQQCGLTNDHGIGNFFKVVRNPESNPFEPPQWYLMLNSSLVPPNKVGARLVSSYFTTQNQQKGCLTLEYIIINDPVIDYMMVYQQDKDNFCIWKSTPYQVEPTYKTQMVSLTVDLSRGDPRYFIEAYIKRSTEDAQGALALVSLRLAYQACPVDQANQCNQVKLPEPPYIP